MIGGFSSYQNQLVETLKEIDEVEMVGHILSGEEAINTYATKNPDIILIDIITDGISGLETARWIKEQNPDIKIIILSSDFNKEFLLAVVTLGFDGYLVKNVDKNILKDAIQSLCTGERYFIKKPSL
jgi:DNA-binding NarL/FixJ family response regulator